MKRIILGFTVIILQGIFVYGAAYAETYWVSPTGQASWKDASGTTPLNGTAACSLAKANANVAPGDTVYLREGAYYSTSRNDCIHPGQSGTAENRIVYTNYNDENVILDGTNSNYEAILFSAGWDTGNPDDGRSYITVKGINFDNWNQLGELRYASYNEITGCDFYGHKGEGLDVVYNGFYLSQHSAHNWIHGNSWHNYGHFVGSDAGCLLNIGHDNVGNAENSGNNYNTVEDNHFYASGHHVVGVNNAKFNIIRNNYIHNEGWSTAGACSDWDTGVCGYRVMSMTDASGLDLAGSNLLEDNNIAYGAGVCNTITDNWGNEGDRQSEPFTPYPDPMFVDPDISDPMELNFVKGRWAGKPDLSLQFDSPVINEAVNLTQSMGSGSNSTTLLVDDAKYFQDGTWGSDLARAALCADWIAIGTVDNIVEIESINYNTNTITLASAMTWPDDAPVWLYKKSNDDVVLYGSGPDYGAYEYVENDKDDSSDDDVNVDDDDNDGSGGGGGCFISSVAFGSFFSS